jgi:hypothetical protein
VAFRLYRKIGEAGESPALCRNGKPERDKPECLAMYRRPGMKNSAGERSFEHKGAMVIKG